MMTLIRTKHSVIQHRFQTLRGRSTELPLSLYLNKSGTYHLNGIGENARKKGRCIHSSSWQSSHRPSCNAFHELDLTQTTKKGRCIHASSWHSSHHPSCNAVHELDLTHTTIKFLASGSYLHVWSFQDYNGDVSILKTLYYKREFDKRNFERHRRDAVTMERLSFSNYIVDIYGYCSNSAIVDYTKDGDLTWLHRQETRLSKLDMLEIAHDVTAALADLHDAGIVHADIKPNQFLNFEGKYKLNDFNRAHFAKQNADTNKTCGFSENHNVGAWRSPEEYLYQPQTKAIDVYSLGHILHFIRTAGVPFVDMNDQQAINFVRKGGRDEYIRDESILNSTHPLDRDIVTALDLCFEFDPNIRASARQIQELFRKALDEVNDS
eukprot:CAMPEP_0202509578 /NCGR_PEP_ID=MMETSP1361-20130828/52844_1 /ASSEMBLY_ACC=CAM_ASM_000849 /TAXON_ID=210615 /ORGANISM="Staurosira complex sp., Strain CCMP2646" /LENGTH=378 /DNA_ID=CAMNT_0049143805 /DNA_START=174 /DNA_END=1311 /DNA_ORIENTATION=+